MHQRTLWDVGGVTGHNHPETSHKAGRTVKSGSQKHQIIQAMYSQWDGVTAYDLYGKILNGAGDPVSTNQIATRLGELRDSGHVQYRRNELTNEIYERETTPSNSGLVQELTPMGRNNAASA